jgi:hypothetical protein
MITDKYQNKTIGIISLVMIKTNLKYLGQSQKAIHETLSLFRIRSNIAMHGL